MLLWPSIVLLTPSHTESLTVECLWLNRKPPGLLWLDGDEVQGPGVLVIVSAGCCLHYTLQQQVHASKKYP